MKNLTIAVALLSAMLVAGVASAATRGVTEAENRLASEFHKRLLAKEIDRETASSLTRIYVRRAYAVQIDPAVSLALLYRKPAWRFDEEQQLRFFALSLDALIRGANLRDIQTSVRDIVEEIDSQSDRVFFVETFLPITGRYAAIPPLVEMLGLTSKDGIVGKRRRDFVEWAVEQVKLGDDPEYIAQIYAITRRVVTSYGSQRDFLTKCYDGVRAGVPPMALVSAVQRMGDRYHSGRQMTDALDRILQGYFNTGISFEEAMNAVVPPPAPAQPGEPEDEFP
jgi:PAS domain-containing protein